MAPAGHIDSCVPGLGDAADIIDRAGASGLNCDGVGLDRARHRAYQTAFGESPSATFDVRREQEFSAQHLPTLHSQSKNQGSRLAMGTLRPIDIDHYGEIKP
jgi:hypothetical protein